MDENEKQEINEVKTENSNHKSKDKNFGGMLLSGIAGGLIVALFSGGIFLSILNDEDNQAQSAQTEQDISEETQQETNDNKESVPTSNVSNENIDSLSEAINRVSDAVVGVSNIQQTSLWEETDAAGTGSGVVYKKEGEYAYVVTNNHVVEGAQEVEVILTNGEKVPADVLGKDSLTDLAVLRISSEQVETVAPLGSSGELTVGETAIAIGNPLGTEFAGSVTRGIISGLERAVDVDLNQDGSPDWTTQVIQTDAAINPGNSGGALINSDGEVIGINSMKIALDAVEGIGFAIPIDDAKPVIEQLETDGEVTRPFIGISAVDLNTVPEQHKQGTLNLDEDVENGVVLAKVQVGSPAEEAGLQKYDVITKINDKELTSMLELKTYLYNNTNIGDEINITYYRDGKEDTTTLKLAEQEEQQ